MRIFLGIFAFMAMSIPCNAQAVLSLDSCRAMALRSNAQINASKLKQEAAIYTRKAVRTQYLPKVDAVGGYEYFSKEVSILNSDQKTALSNLGTNVATSMGSSVGEMLTGLAQNGLISVQSAQDLGTIFNQMGQPIATAGNQFGQEIRDAFKTDTHNIWEGAVMVRQPIYMGGAITAANRMADIAERMAADELEGKTQSALYDVDQTYWLVVSLKQKKKLAESYCKLVKKLDDDVHKMIREGVATKADGLKVDVKVNEAEMAITQVDNGLTLSKMLLCQLCGMPINTEITLVDEDKEDFAPVDETASLSNDLAQENRSELKLLDDAVELSRQTTRLARATYMPQIALTGGYMFSNPNCFNGFEKKFAGVWNVGILVRLPIWNWGEGEYKVRATEAATTIAMLEAQDAREKIDLQVNQCRFKVNEANKRLATANKNLANAEENLRCANVGFREGVMESTDVMAAQTAWQSAQTQRIDAEIDAKLSQVNLKKALGVLQ